MEKSQNQSGNTLDIFGKCPCCEESWLGPEINEALATIEVVSRGAIVMKDNADKLASNYGWTPDNGKRFSNVTQYSIQLPKDHTGNTDYVQCSNAMCMRVFDVKTSEMFDSMYQVRKMLEVSNSAAEVVD